MIINDLNVYGIIYKITNTINNKVYIGQTTKERGFLDRYPHKGNGIERVYKYHKRNKDSNQGYNEHLFRAIEKYGMDVFEVIEVFDYAYTQQELDEKEIYYINKFDSYNNGYNNTLGGGGKLGTTGLSGIDSPNSKKVYQISCEGEIIKLWECISDVNRVLHIDSSKICCVCRGRRKTAQGFVWVYEEDYDPNKDYSTKPRSKIRTKGLKPVTLLSEDGLTILKQYRSVNDAAEDLKISTYEVSNTCKNKIRNKNFNLTYTNEIYRGTTTKRESLVQEIA